jgi:RecA/RadA recombinase
MSSLREKLIKNSTVDLTDTLLESKVFTKKDMIPTSVPMINVALSGSTTGGLVPGITMLAGPSKHFKSGFSLLLCQSFLQKYPDGIILFYDSEFGSPQSYFSSFGIPLNSVVHTPITNVEELKFDITTQLSNIVRDDKIMIIIDSIGNLASKKEVEDAINEKSVADMTRAKQLKSLFRIVTPHLTLKDIPMVVVNHTYKEMSLFPKDIVSGGTGGYYSSDAIWILGRQQNKDGDELAGYHFIINIEKSRYVQEKSKIPITVSFDGGINRWSGLFDVALEGKYIVPGKKGWYNRVDMETGEVMEPAFQRSKVDNNSEFWGKMFLETDIESFIEKTYKISNSAIMGEV